MDHNASIKVSVPAEHHEGAKAAALNSPFGCCHIQGNGFKFGSAIRAFVPTDSTHPWILGTLNESNAGGLGVSIWCGYRKYEEMDGIMVTIFLAGDPDNPAFDFTVFQNGASTYGQPVPYPGM